MKFVVCDFNIQGTAKRVNDTQCNSPCSGDNSYSCGGAGYISIYQDKGHNGVLPASPDKVGNGRFKGATSLSKRIPALSMINSMDVHRDNINVTKTIRRTLSQRVDISAGATIEKCISQCASKAYSISGLEFGQERCTFPFPYRRQNTKLNIHRCRVRFKPSQHKCDGPPQ